MVDDSEVTYSGNDVVELTDGKEQQTPTPSGSPLADAIKNTGGAVEQQSVVTQALTEGVADGTISAEAAGEIISIYGELLQRLGEQNFFPGFDVDMAVEAIVSNLGNPEQAVMAMRDLLTSTVATQDRQLNERVEARNQSTAEFMKYTETENLRLRQREHEQDMRDYEYQVAAGNRQALQIQAQGMLDVAEAVDTSQRGWGNLMGQLGSQGLLVPAAEGAYYGGAEVYRDIAREAGGPYAEPRQIGGPIEVPDLAQPFDAARQAIMESAQEIEASQSTRPALQEPPPYIPPIGPAG